MVKVRNKIKSSSQPQKLTKTIKKSSKKWKPTSKVGRIVLKNLPFKATKQDVEKLLLKYGDLREVKLLQRPDGSPVGCGFAQFTRKESAARAVKECSDSDFMGRKITIDWALPKAEYILKTSPTDDETSIENATSTNSLSNENEADNLIISAEVGESEPETQKHKKKIKGKKVRLEAKEIDHLKQVSHKNDSSDDEESRTDVRNERKVKQDTLFSESENDPDNQIKIEKEVSVKQKRKIKVKKHPKKKGRLIVRNLSFKITEDQLREHFSKYGEITDINLLKKPDGKLVGCAFVQFEKVQSAAKAILGSSGKPLIGRTIVIDWAIPHDKYVEATTKEESMAIKTEKTDVEDKQHSNHEGSLQETLKEESEPESEVESDKSIKKEDASDDSADDTASNTEEAFSDEESTKEMEKKPRIISNDVKEGCTVFVKNVPFSATNEELKSCMEQFGHVIYALICIDPLTEHSKGTAFVKFQERECAEKCLEAGTELTLKDQTLDVFKALSRDDIQQKLSKKDSEVKKDGRNLYLVKEGVVMAGTPAAVGVSVTDMARRLELEKWKSQILRNLNMFVSPTRLVVHNIPPSWTDAQLRALFQNHSGAGAVITEARIMRDLRNVNADGIGKSKEYGFVSFKTHDAALTALRCINNNPKIFTPHKRPIVSFSIENRTVLKAKQQRLERSRANFNSGNNTSKNVRNFPKSVKKDNHNSEPNRGKRKPRTEHNDVKKVKLENPQTETNEFAGVISKPGNVKLPTKFALKKQATLHAKNVKQRKKKEKLQQLRKKQHVLQEPIRQPKQKQNSRRKHKEEDKTFNKLISSYKSKLNTASEFKKWYE